MYIVRYEDLVTDPKDTMMGLMSFLFGVKDLTGTNIERRIDEVVQKGDQGVQMYKMKATTGRFDANANLYTPEQRKAVQDAFGDWMYYYGYADVENNPTGFFFKD